MAELILLVIAATCAIIASLWEFTRGPHFGWLAVLFLILALIAGSVGGQGLGKRSEVSYPFSRAVMDKISTGVCAELTPDTRVTVVTQSVDDPLPACDFDHKLSDYPWHSLNRAAVQPVDLYGAGR